MQTAPNSLVSNGDLLPSVSTTQEAETPTRVLLLGENQGELTRVRDLLGEVQTNGARPQNGSDFVVDWVLGTAAGLEAIGRNEHDIVLLDSCFGAQSGLD